jgi:hypothetical protein
VRRAYSGAWVAKCQSTQFRSGRFALTLNDDIPGLDGDLDPLGDFEQFLGVAVAQLSVKFGIRHFASQIAPGSRWVLWPGEKKCKTIGGLGNANWTGRVHVLHLEGGLLLWVEVAGGEFATTSQCALSAKR